MHKLLLYIYFTFFLQLDAFSQIRLENPSFEGDPQDATVPVGWFPCEEGSTPDLLPGPWAVYQTPSDGQSFMGLITREDGTWENVGQRLSQPMQNGQCYYMDIDLAFSDTYAGYNQPIKFRIWGGYSRCEKQILLGHTVTVNHTDWRTYRFLFAPNQPINYIIFEAYYPNPANNIYKGNILIDNCSAIKVCIRA